MGFFKNRRRNELAEALMDAPDDQPQREFSWISVAVWAVRLLYWLLKNHPQLMLKILLIQRRIAEEMPGDDKIVALEVCNANERLYMRNKDVLQRSVRELKQ